MAVVALTCATAIERLLLRRDPPGAVAAVAVTADMSPGMRFVTVALGGFRGMAADLLWLRATRLQDEGRYVELAQLAEWITLMEPACPQIRTYHPWNMAYHLRAAMAGADDRWRWVLNGLRLLRDRGIPSNPAEPELYAELAWLHLHKIGGLIDGADLAYHRRWVLEMSALTGPSGALPAQSEALRRACRLDPATLRTVDATYGPLDWRSPLAHAVYWAHAGLAVAPGGRDIRCNRALYQAMIQSVFAGAAGDPGTDAWTPGPRPDLIAPCLRGIDAMLRAYPADEGAVAARRGFLENAALLLDAAGQPTAARELFARARPAAAGNATEWNRFRSDPALRLAPYVSLAILNARRKEQP